MIRISLVVEHVSLQFVLGSVFFIGGLLEVRVFLHLFKLVAFIIAASGWSMFWPFAKAYPAEVSFAQLARHMVAPSALFDWSLASWTRFRVCHDPSHVLTLSLTLLDPLGWLFTIGGLMWTLLTCEAEWNTADTLDFLVGGKEFPLEAIFTTDFWAPLDWVVIVCVRLAQPFPVSLLVLRTRGENFFKDAVSDFKVALYLHTPCFDASWSAPNFLNQVVSPAVFAESMVTLEGKHIASA